MPSSKMEVKHLNSPDEVRKFEKGKIDLVKIGGATVGRAKFEPGWKWSKHVKPIAKTMSCEAPHFQYHVSGVLHIVMDDGTEKDVGPGEISLVPQDMTHGSSGTNRSSWSISKAWSTTPDNPRRNRPSNNLSPTTSRFLHFLHSVRSAQHPANRFFGFIASDQATVDD